MAILCNEWRHLHAHFIPRFETPITFFEIVFIDPNPKGNYSPYDRKNAKLDEEKMLKLIELLKEELPKMSKNKVFNL
jgi:diadenosine tetraphosphate (Ap4A) HIT family hydrolase